MRITLTTRCVSKTKKVKQTLKCFLEKYDYRDSYETKSKAFIAHICNIELIFLNMQTLFKTVEVYTKSEND